MVQWTGLVLQSQVYKEVKERISYVASFVRTEGLMAFAEAEWLRLNIPLIFRSFWMMRFGIHLYLYLSSSELDTWADPDNLKTLFKILLIRGCETLPAILGMSSIFSWIAGKVNKPNNSDFDTLLYLNYFSSFTSCVNFLC